MLLTGLLIAGGAGTLYSSIQYYRKNDTKTNQLDLRKTGDSLPSTLTGQSNAIDRIQLQKSTAASSSSQLLPKKVDSETIINNIEEWIDYYLSLATLALGGAIAGIWFHPLALASAAILAFLTFPMCQRIYWGLVKQRRLKFDITQIIVLPLMILSGYLPAAAFGYWLYYLGLKLLAKSKDHSKDKLTHIFNEQLRSVWIQQDGYEVEIAVEDLQLADIVVVQGGGIIPIDGVIVQGMADIDQRAMTGESQPAEKGEGDSVFAFTIVLTGKVWIAVEKNGKETVAAQIDQLLNQTTNFAASVELRTEKIADQLTLPSLLLGAFAWPVAGYTSALVVLGSPVIENFYITGALSVLSHLSLASHHKILIKDGRALEQLRQVDTVVFDKTGTLTQEIPHVGKIHACGSYTEKETLFYAAIAEYKQSHPIARAILQASQEQGLVLPTIDDTQYELGYGVKVPFKNRLIRVGSARFMGLEDINLSAEIETKQSDCHRKGYSLVYVALDDTLVGVIELRPTIRPEAKHIIHQLKQRNLSIYIISGDHEAPTQALAQELGIDHYFAETLPENKADLIEQLQQQGKSVCFIGDGINDAIALKKANVSISLSGASTIATDTAQVVLMDDSLNQLIKLFELADNLKQNFRNSMLWDVIPNSICIGGAFFFHLGIYGALAIYTAGLAGGVINGLWPALEMRKNDVRSSQKDLSKN